MVDIRSDLNYESEEEKNLKKILTGEILNYEPFLHSARFPINPEINPAKRTYEIVAGYIEEFQKNLDHEQEVGAHLVSFGREYTFNITDISYSGPNIIVFYGLDNKQHPIQLVQSINQLNVLLIAVEKIGENPRRFGFNLDGSK